MSIMESYAVKVAEKIKKEIPSFISKEVLPEEKSDNDMPPAEFNERRRKYYTNKKKLSKKKEKKAAGKKVEKAVPEVDGYVDDSDEEPLDNSINVHDEFLEDV